MRRVAAEGAYAVLRRRGAAEAGAIYVLVDRLDGQAALLRLAEQLGLGRLALTHPDYQITRSVHVWGFA